TERKQYEATLEETNQQLRRATRLKDEFLANMSHELRTPLNAILGMAEVLQEQVFGPVTPKQRNCLATIERSGQHLLSLINDILDVAKIESGQVELDAAPIAIASLCTSSLTFIKQQAQKKSLRLVTELPAYPLKIDGDERRLRQVLINLLNNAVKFTPEGGTITLAVKDLTAAPSPTLQIAVQDTGIGISPEDQAKLFQPFIQVDSALNRKYEGTGLGLVLVKRIVELHGGHIDLTSTVGEGSCFTLTLPAHPVVISPVAAAAAASPTAATNAPMVDQPLILLTEDNLASVETTSAYLEAKGYRLQVAHNGQEALAAVDREIPDLILMDIQMPDMDGLTAIQHLRKKPGLATVPIIALTALAMADDRDRCLAAGANEYLSKPIRLKVLHDTMQTWLHATP
ncbi:MAG: ATP-binding protein, partial [Leptolyngbya sp.]|nr:ATP-binding protein [Leptolyngbya sp.]